MRNSTKFAIIVLTMLVGIFLYALQDERVTEKKDEDLGREVTIKMPNGVTISTYEKFIKFEGDKIYLINDFTKDYDVTEGDIKYE